MNYPTIFPELSTERLVLRQLTLNDRKAIFKLRSNKEINKLIVRETPKNLNEAAAFIQVCLDEFEKEHRIFWAITLKSNAQIIGTIVFHNIIPENNYAEIGYELNPDYQKEGFMNEALAGVLDYGKVTLNLKLIEAFTHKNNNASISLLEKYQFSLLEDKKDEAIEDNRVFSLEIQ